MTMSCARKSDGLLSAESVSRLLTLISQNPGSFDAIVSIAVAQNLGSKPRIINSVQLLIDLNLACHFAEYNVRALTSNSNLDRSYSLIRNALVEYYCSKFKLEIGSNLFQREPNSDELLVDRERLPLKQYQLPFLVADFEILDRLPGRHWRISREFRSNFDRVIEVGNEQSISGTPLKPDALERWIKNRRKAGETAEIFALEYERLRLQEHPMLEQLRWVATEDTGAGFDLLSFDSLHSVSLDRFIEVKGHSGDRGFHWSSGEIERARVLGNAYWIYLIDRSQLGNDCYTPEVYQDPYSYFIETNPDLWCAEATNYKFLPSSKC